MWSDRLRVTEVEDPDEANQRLNQSPVRVALVSRRTVPDRPCRQRFIDHLIARRIETLA